MPHEIEQVRLDESEKLVSFLDADLLARDAVASTRSHLPAGQRIFNRRHPKSLAWAHSQADVSLIKSVVRNRNKLVVRFYRGLGDINRDGPEAVDFMKLRADRRKVAKAGPGIDEKAMVTVPATSSTAGESLGA